MSDLELLGRLIEEVNVRHAHSRLTDRAAQDAIKLNTEADRRLTEALRTMRDLLAALSSSAGLSKAVKVDEVRAEAHRILGDDEATDVTN